MTTAMSTNTSNQTFDGHRFTIALRKEIVENKRQLLLGMVAMILTFTSFMVIGNVISNAMRDYDTDALKTMDFLPAAMISTTYTFVVAIAASLSFRNLTSKNGRVALFTSPSSTVEKFIVNLLIYVIGVAIAFFACAQLADLLRIAILFPFKSDTFVVPGPTNIFSILLNSTQSIMNVSEKMLSESPAYYRGVTLISLALGPAIYFMGSVLWPRWAVVKTFACQQLINTVLSAIVFALIFGFISPDIFNPEAADINEMSSFFSNYTRITTYIALVISALCWVGSWFLFKRKDVVSLKWWS